ncbi:hypothetical protein Bpfe_026555 [Biomphalaria pfeifferi]|uniref:Uncharacterized protein n=1 Tax=Biomphalaria pfeifferi TaxID=112525 RepID=A0AAD8AX55_BIOPF|nr:hypothetical protein Bpfe_026555 [Biomphalaria pfeifferi]
MSGLVRHSLNRIVPVMRSNVVQKASVISGPRNPVPFTTKLAVGGVMCFTIVAPMFWIMANIKHYKNPEGVSS